MKYLVTGAAGFIGYHVADRLLAGGHDVLGVDNLNAYYEPALKEARLSLLREHPAFRFVKLDIANAAGLRSVVQATPPDIIIHLAAQAGVRYSLQQPHAYVDANVTGFLNVLECARHLPVQHLVYASTSSVYGLNTDMPFSVHRGTAHPVSLYAATKMANEHMAHAYSHLFGIPCTGLRFFTVYGPWGRPDMALFKWTRAILAGDPIEIYNDGDMERDFTYVDDIVDGVLAAAQRPPRPDPFWKGEEHDPGTSAAPWRVLNIGGERPVALMDVVEMLERALRRPALKRMMPMQRGDVMRTCADASDLAAVAGVRPQVGLEEGIARFVTWYRRHYALAATSQTDNVREVSA